MNTFDAPGRDRLREIYAAIDSAAALLRPGQPVRRHLGAAAVYAAAQSMEGLNEAGPAARRAHSLMVADGARAVLPFARAASTHTASTGAAARRGDGCQIRIEQSRAEPNQYFVLVELARTVAAEAPTSLVVCDQDDHCSRFPLPAARDGVAQLIADGDSELMRLISDPASKVYLR